MYPFCYNSIILFGNNDYVQINEKRNIYSGVIVSYLIPTITINVRCIVLCHREFHEVWNCQYLIAVKHSLAISII